MAKWGEGDPRWLVEERPDAKNVNNWHWIEKNAKNWSKDKFQEILPGTKVETDFAHCEITEITKCEGDAVVNNRKAKIIVFYEWMIEMKWTGTLTNSDTNVMGTINIPNLSEEYDMKDVEVSISIDSTGAEADILKDVMRTTGVSIIRRQLTKYITALKEDFSKGLILPTKETLQSENIKGEDKIKSPNVFEPAIVGATPNKVLETGEIKFVETFKCTANDFYRAMTEKVLVEAFTRGNCVFDEELGKQFELFDGNVQGYFTEKVPFKIIKQKWRLKKWPEAYYSDVSFNIFQKDDCTEVTVLQTGVPKTEIESTREGWKRFYWDSIKRTFGFGVFLY